MCVSAVKTLSFAFMPVEKSFIFFFFGSFIFSHCFSKSCRSNSRYILERICFISSMLSCELNPDSARETPIFCLTAGESSFPSLPRTEIFPLSGFVSPSISFIAVLFPAPFFPTSPVILPSGISIDISNSKSPYFFRTFCIFIMFFIFPFCNYFSSRSNCTSSVISSFSIPIDNARSIALSNSSSTIRLRVSMASCLSEADTYVPFP